ncbi:hypothetical protein TorRG33x02_052890, partial [Trema orientale]
MAGGRRLAQVRNWSGDIGIGVVIRDYKGQVRGTLVTRKKGQFNAYLDECLALKE